MAKLTKTAKAAAKAVKTAAKKTAATARKDASAQKKKTKASAKLSASNTKKADAAKARVAKKLAKLAKPKKKPHQIAVVITDHPLVLSLIAAQPPLTAAYRQVFAGLADDAACDALGVKTKSAGVFKDAVSWLKPIRDTLANLPTSVDGYSVPRFVWMMECVSALGIAIEEQDASQSGIGTVRTASATARATALTWRKNLTGKLTTLAGLNPDAKDAVVTAAGKTKTDGDLVGAIRNLIVLAQSWLKLAANDAGKKILVDSVSLKQTDLDTANHAAEALVAAAGETRSTRLVPNDTPAVNRVEGRVLFEMATVMRVFDDAHLSDHKVPRLTPGVATRGELVNHHATVAVAPAAPPADAPAVGTPAAPNAPNAPNP